MLLTFDEYVELSGNDKILKNEFEPLYKKAVQLLHVITRNYYKLNNFDDDTFIRKDAVKMALSAQIDFFVETGQTTIESLNSVPNSITLGRTTISTNSRYSSNVNKKEKSIYSQEFLMFLQGTGLLYRGVDR